MDPIKDIEIRRINVSYLTVFLGVMPGGSKKVERDGYGHWWFQFGDESYGWWPSESVGLIDTVLGVKGDLNGVALFNQSRDTMIIRLYTELQRQSPGQYSFQDIAYYVDNDLLKDTIRPSATRDAHHGDSTPSIPKRAKKGKLIKGPAKNTDCACATEEQIKDCLREFAEKFSGQWNIMRSCHTFVETGKTTCCLAE